MEDIRKQAIEAARDHAHSVDDLITQAQKIEAYLTGRAYRTANAFPADDDTGDFDVKSMLGPIESVEPDPLAKAEPELTPKQIKEAEDLAMLPKMVQTTATALGMNADKLVKALQNEEPDAIADLAKEIADLAGVVPCDPPEEHVRRDRAVAANKKLLEACETLDLFSEPMPKRSDPTRYVKDYRYVEGGKEHALSPFFQFLADDESSYVLNVARSIGTTNFLAALAREWRSKGRKVLVVVHNHTAARIMEILIDDTSVNVVDFKHLEKWGAPATGGDPRQDNNGVVRAIDTWDLVLIDNAAAIPYASEANILNRLSTVAATRVIVASVPGQERGLFYDLWTGSQPLSGFLHELYRGGETDAKFTKFNKPVKKLALNWTFATYGDTAKAKATMDKGAWANLYENQFRPIKD